MPNTYIKTLTDKDGNQIAPRTHVNAVILSDGITNLQEKLEDIETQLGQSTSPTAENIPIEDLGDHFISTNVEESLQELGEKTTNLSSFAVAMAIALS